MEKIIHKLISEFTKGVDIYTHNGSTWLIFTGSKQWVIELTEEKTLWYNYTFFREVFSYTSLNVVDNQQYITKWVEDNIINKVSDIHFRDARDKKQQFDDTLENGVKKTKGVKMKTDWSVEDTIENGVKETYLSKNSLSKGIEYTIKNGVKETKSDDFNVSQFLCEEVIDKGVKETKISPTSSEYGDWLDGDEKLDEIIKNGVKETLRASYLNVDNVIQDGVLETYDCDWDVPTDLIEDVINDGVKDTKVCNYTDPETQLMTIKWWRQIEDVIENGNKISGTFVGGKLQKCKTDTVINYGVKEIKVCNYIHPEMTDLNLKMDYQINEVIENGVKETKWANKYNHIGPIFKEDKIQEVLEKGIKTPTG